MSFKYKIVSDGRVAHTRVYDPNGHELPDVVAVQWQLDARGKGRSAVAYATITVLAELEAEAESACVTKYPRSSAMSGLTTDATDEKLKEDFGV
jgi:hypothetical protein